MNEKDYKHIYGLIFFSRLDKSLAVDPISDEVALRRVDKIL